MTFVSDAIAARDALALWLSGNQRHISHLYRQEASEIIEALVFAGFRIERHEPKPDDPAALLARAGRDGSQLWPGGNTDLHGRPITQSAQSEPTAPARGNS